MLIVGFFVCFVSVFFVLFCLVLAVQHWINHWLLLAFISTSDRSRQFQSVPSSLKCYTLTCRLYNFKKMLLGDITERVFQTTHLCQCASVTHYYTTRS